MPRSIATRSHVSFVGARGPLGAVNGTTSTLP